jgi:transposase
MSDNQERQVFREAVFDLLKLRDRQRELKSLIKDRFRSRGILDLAGTGPFHPVKRQRWLGRLPAGHRHGIELLYDLFDTALGAWRKQLREVRRLGAAFPEIQLFQEVPGVGEVGAAVFCAIIEDPHRFQTASQLHRYSALGITSRSSDGKPLGYERLERRGQRELKNLSFHAWRTGIRAGSQCDVVRRFYLASKLRTGTARHGRLNTQRKILTTLWLMWKNHSHFQPERFLHNPPQDPPRKPRRRRRSRRSRSR